MREIDKLNLAMWALFIVNAYTMTRVFLSDNLLDAFQWAMASLFVLVFIVINVVFRMVVAILLRD